MQVAYMLHDNAMPYMKFFLAGINEKVIKGLPLQG